MTTSIDSNVIVALWWRSDPLNQDAARVLEQAHRRGPLTIAAPVYAELMGDPARTEFDLNEFLGESRISVEWVMEEEIWREAGRAYRGYIQRRWSSSKSLPRRILSDFLIGAHASIRGYTLLTLDQRLYAAAFPTLSIASS